MTNNKQTKVDPVPLSVNHALEGLGIDPDFFLHLSKKKVKATLFRSVILSLMSLDNVSRTDASKITKDVQKHVDRIQG